MKRISIVLLAMVFLLAGCAASSGSEASKNTPSADASEPGSAFLAEGDLMKLVSANKVEGRTADEAFRLSQLRLALELFEASAEESEGENVLISPISVQIALAMTANGANGQTRDEMEALLGGEIALEELNEYLYSYVNALPTDGKYKVSFANSIWFRDREDFKVYENFLQTNADYYGAQAYAAPFDTETVKQINEWVKTHTDGMIEKVLEKIEEENMMFLINALVFDAEWQSQYDKYAVREGDFTNLAGDVLTAEMMYSEESRYFETDSATGFAKNYKDGKYSFVAMLPNEGVDLYEYIGSLTPEGLMSTLDNMKTGSVYAVMPKFSYEYQLEMKDLLAELGMPSAVDSGADFSRMSNEELYISGVLHKTFISVAEQGTKAGAVTVVTMDTESAPMYNLTVTLDRPFVYMIVDNENNLPLFIGTVVDL